MHHSEMSLIREKKRTWANTAHTQRQTNRNIDKMLKGIAVPHIVEMLSLSRLACMLVKFGFQATYVTWFLLKDEVQVSATYLH